jgi:hypothetical protein
MICGKGLSIYFCFFLNIILCLSSQTALAQVPPPPVMEIDTVSSIATRSDLGNYTALHAAAYYCAPAPSVCVADGGEGLFVKNNTGPCNADGGSVIQDAAMHPRNCWYRQNVKGDLRQWGLTADSPYDAIYAKTNTLTQLNASHIMNVAIASLQALGITEIHTKQVNLLIGLDTFDPLKSPALLTLPAGSSLTCDAPPAKTPQNGNFSNLRGSLILARGEIWSGDGHYYPNYIDAASNNDVEIHDCAAIIPQWYINPALADQTIGNGWPCSWTPLNTTAGQECGITFVPPYNTTPPLPSYLDLDAIRANMASAGDVAIKSGRSGKIHDLGILGFDNCVWAYGSPGFIAKNLAMDCNIGLYMSANGGATTAKDFDNDPFLTKQTNADVQLYWDVSNIVPVVPTGGGPPFCHVTVQVATTQSGTAAPSLATFGTYPNYIQSLTTPHGDPYHLPMWISGLKNAGFSCKSDGTGPSGSSPGWAIQHVSSDGMHVTFDLAGSVFACTFAPSCPAPVLTSQGDWLANTGMIRIAGSIANLQSGMYVTSADPSWPACGGNPCQLTITGVIARATGPDPNDGYNGYIIVSRPPTSASAGGGNTLVGLSFSNPPNGTLPDGNVYTDDSPCKLQDGPGGDGNPVGNCAIFFAAQRYVAGYSAAGVASSRLPSSRGGTFAAGTLLDGTAGFRAINIFDFDHYYGIATIDAATCDFSETHGDGIAQINNTNKVAIYVAGASRGCTFVSDAAGDKPGAALVSDLYGTVDDTMASDVLNGVTVTSLGQYGTANITLPVSETVPTTWPSIGVLHICSAESSGSCVTNSAHEFDEFVDYTYNPASPATITITGRARFGTAPVNWSGSVGSSVYLFWTTINSGANDNPGKSSATIFMNMGDATNGPTGNHFEIHHGGAILTNTNASVSGNAFISTNTLGVAISGASEPKTLIQFEDANARILTTVSADSIFANYAGQGALNLPLSYYQPFGSPQSLTYTDLSGAVVALPPDYAGDVAVQDTTNLPATGVLRVDAEFIAYHVDGTATLYLDSRGLCGSQPAAHAIGAMGSYMALLYGCGIDNGVTAKLTMDSVGNVGFAQSSLSHGQVYMTLVSLLNDIQLCPQSGQGLIISGVMREVQACSIVPVGSGHTTASTFYYVYAAYHQVAVTNIADVGGTPGNIRLYFGAAPSPALPDFYAGSPITCYGITGSASATANVVGDVHTGTGTDGTGPYIDLLDVAGTAHPHGTGACEYVGLEISTTTHTTASNGVEIYGTSLATSNPALTLVGGFYSDTTNTAHDTPTQRDVESWFNRQIKTCQIKWTGTATATGTFPAEFKMGSPATTPLHCEFVTWGQGDVDWKLFGAIANTTLSEMASASAGFDGATSAFEVLQFEQNNANQHYPLALGGSVKSMSQGVHYMTTLGGAPTGPVTITNGGGEEIRIPQ